MKTIEQRIIEKYEELIKLRCKHSPACNLNQNWDEARQALSDTPMAYRDEGYYLAVEEINEKSTRCNCGFDKIQKELSDLKALAEQPTFQWDDNKVIDFISWYLKLCKLSDRFEIENQTILDSFKRGDKPEMWHEEQPECEKCTEQTCFIDTDNDLHCDKAEQPERDNATTEMVTPETVEKCVYYSKRSMACDFCVCVNCKNNRKHPEQVSAEEILAKNGFFVPNDNEYLKAISGMIVKSMHEYASLSRRLPSEEEIMEAANEIFPELGGIKNENIAAFEIGVNWLKSYIKG